MKNQMETKKYIKVLVELSIWFLFLFLVVNIYTFFKNREARQYETYQIFMQDVDGVIEGSAVNMMGVPVGYVKQVDIVNDEVYVSFTLNKKGLKLPKGSVVTVEFSGLGGSKSLVVYPSASEVEGGSTYLYVQEPTRLGDSISLVFEMLDKVSSIGFRTSHAMKELSKINPNKDKKEFNPKEVTKQLKEADKWIDNTNSKLEKFNINKGEKDGR